MARRTAFLRGDRKGRTLFSCQRRERVVQRVRAPGWFDRWSMCGAGFAFFSSLYLVCLHRGTRLDGLRASLLPFTSACVTPAEQARGSAGGRTSGGGRALYACACAQPLGRRAACCCSSRRIHRRAIRCCSLTTQRAADLRCRHSEPPSGVRMCSRRLFARTQTRGAELLRPQRHRSYFGAV